VPVSGPSQRDGAAAPEELRTPVLVLGIGNLLWADEGFGVRCVEALHERYELPPGVELLDGGTQGIYLANTVAAAERVLVFDALDYGDPPGTMRVVRDADVPAFHGVRKMSLHQTGFQEVLAAAELLGHPPRHVTLVGVQLEQIDDFGGTLSPPVAAQLDAALALGLAELSTWGYPARPRAQPAPSLLSGGLERARYEADRPSADVVCRGGDARFLNVRAAAAAGAAGAAGVAAPSQGR
jgi:hydrogenase maturation protease